MRQYLVFGIFLYISQRGKVSARQIAEKFEISTRTVYRYVDAISYVGVPIECSQGRNGGIFISKNFKLESLAFSVEEKNTIKQALLSQEKNSCIDKILSTLK